MSEPRPTSLPKPPLRPRRPLRRRDALHTHSLRFGPNMTPMVDIVMVILIFFMAATTFAGDEWFLRTGLVSRETSTATRRPASDPFALPPVRLSIELSVDESGRTIGRGVGVQDAKLDSLLGALAAFCEGTATDQIVLVVSASPRVPYRDVVRVHDAATALKIEKIGLQTE